MNIKNKKELNIIKSQPLSNFDLNEILKNSSSIETNIYNYDHLKNVFHIDEIFDALGRCIILLPVHSIDNGHWIALIKRDNIIEFFDSYGKTLDQQENNLNSNFDIDEDLLKDLVKKAGYKLQYSKIQNQPAKFDVATCGRHAIFRIIFFNLTNKEYNNLLKKISKKHNVKPDDIVTAYSNEYLLN
jgi:hypothetical protein